MHKSILNNKIKTNMKHVCLKKKATCGQEVPVHENEKPGQLGKHPEKVLKLFF